MHDDVMMPRRVKRKPGQNVAFHTMHDELERAL
jgi:hypothetical protein